MTTAPPQRLGAPPATPWRRMRLGLAVLAVDALVLLVLFAAGWRGLAAEEAQRRSGAAAPGGNWPGVTELRERLVRERPSVVFVGDSLVSEAIDPALFAEKTGRRALEMASPGSGSALWYLIVKNVLAPSADRPATVVLCFRDIHLAQPARNTTGKYAERIARLTAGPEPELDRQAYGTSDRPLDRALLRAARVYERRDFAAAKVSGWLKEGVSALCGAGRGDAAEVAIARVFDYHRLDPRLATLRQSEDESAKAPRPDAGFDASVGASFLPAIATLCRDAGMRLVLVNMRRRPEALELHPEEKDDATRRAFVRSLRGWAAARGVALLDYADEERLTLDLYADGDHLNRTAGRPLFTAMLAEAMVPLLAGEAPR